jgi:PAS domain S-box-containing protein
MADVRKRTKKRSEIGFEQAQTVDVAKADLRRQSAVAVDNSLSMTDELARVNAELKAKIEELNATASDLSSLLSSTHIAVIFLDTRMQIRRVTPAIADFIDLLPSDIGRPTEDLATKCDDSDLLVDCKRVLDRLIPIEKEIRHPNGRVYMQRILPYRTNDNRIDGVVITFLDVSNLRRAETALDDSEFRFRCMIENVTDFAMLLMDPKGRIITWNVGAERLLGWSSAEAVGKSGAMIFSPESAQEQSTHEMERAAEFGRAADEGWHVRKSGARFWGSGVLTAVRDEAGELTGFVKVLRDETARKQAETERAELLKREQSARAEAENATRLKDQFLAMLSHELRTPISSILVWARMLRENLCEPSEREEGLEVIERSAEAQKQLLDDLLDVSRIASGKTRLERTETNLTDLVRLAIDSHLPTAKAKNVTLKTELATDIGAISADPDRLRQVAGNLVHNAVKFTPSGGRVEVHLRKDGDWIVFSVSDTGKGIEPEFLPHVFTAFSQADVSSTRAFGGLGLGLAISKELVELHGGTIIAESKGAGEGSTFTVRLPLTEPDTLAKRKGRKREANASKAGLAAGTKILLIEDEQQTRDAVELLLEKSGAAVTSTATAAEAFAAFEKSRPDVIISDIGLPEEDGYQLLQRIRTLEMENKEPPTPAIALTAFASNTDRRLARESGFHKHIAKPVTAAMLLAAVATLLNDKERAENGG